MVSRNWTRRRWLAASSAVPFAACTQPAPTAQKGAEPVPEGGELDEVEAAELLTEMESGERTARQVAELYLARMDAIDSGGPRISSVIERNPDALAIADELDAERASGKLRGPLHGLPILLKDNIDTGDKMLTTAGSLALTGKPAERDSFAAERLRAAGALILGKTNLSEWANFRSNRSTSGWSGRGGLTKNPYALDRNACGSSSGSGAAVAASLCAFAIGTETNGSIVCPSSKNGLVGIKPTVGLVGRSGIIPISETQDTAGPMTRTVRDGALLLGALTGTDPRDPRTESSAEHRHSDYTQFLDPEGMKGARIGVVRNHFTREKDTVEIINAALKQIETMGATLVDDIELPRGEYGSESFDVMKYEFKAGLNNYLATRSGVAVKTLAELIAYNEANAEREMPYFGQEILIESEEMGPLTDPDYKKAVEKTLRLARGGIDDAMEANNLDALVAPTGGPAWVTDLIHGDRGSGGVSSPAARAGYPHITVPAGFIYGLPVGISFFGRAWSEPTLLRIAYAFEQKTKIRERPKFLPSIMI